MLTESNLARIDKDAFARDVESLRAELLADLGAADFFHLRRMILWGRLCSVIGYLTAWLLPNPVSALFMSQGILFRWALMHHISHRGYDRVPGVPARFTSRRFAQGRRRYLDWFDWMYPDAWSYEHNNLHHMNTGHDADPDLIERNAEWLRASNFPLLVKYGIIFLCACTWKWSYYVPSTVRAWQRAKRRRAGYPDPISDEESLRQFSDLRDPRGRIQRKQMFNPATAEGRQVWFECLLPYAILRFGAIPALFGVVIGLLASIDTGVSTRLSDFHIFWLTVGNSPGASACLNVLLNSLLAEVFTNIHSFILITPNHAGDDLSRFPARPHGKAEWYLKQVVGCVNYNGGADLLDFLQAYMNYHIEHHLWPDLPMLKYRQARPRLRGLCEKHGVPYLQESVWKRLVKMLKIATGEASMLTGITRNASSPRTGRFHEPARASNAQPG